MEIQGKKTSINKRGILIVFFGIFSGWLLDVFSTSMGLILGFVESSPFFLAFPMGWLLILSLFSLAVFYAHSVPIKIRSLILVWIIFLSYLPSIHNLVMIWSVVI